MPKTCKNDCKEEFKISGDKLLQTVKKLIKEGNARKITIKNEKQETLLVIPLTVGAIGVIIAPVLAAIGALAALVTDCHIVVEKKKPSTTKKK